MAEGPSAVSQQCCVCSRPQQLLQSLRSLRCGHPICHECRAGQRHPVCRQCTVPMMSASRPESFAEFNLEMSLTSEHRECEEKTESCPFRGQARKCNHCNLYLCAEHVRRHGQMVLDSAADDVRKLQVFRRLTSQQMESATAQEYRRFKEFAESKLSIIAQAVQALDATVRQPIATYETQLEKHSEQRDKTLGEIDKMLEQLKAALESGHQDEVLNAQRTFQYMQSTGAYSAAQREFAPRLQCELQAATLEDQINAVVSALQGLRELRLPSSSSVAPSEQAEVVSTRFKQQPQENRISCLYLSLGLSTAVNGSKIVTFGKPLDVDCYKAPNEPLVLFVAEANEDESKVTLRSYSELGIDSKVLPIEFVRNQQVITNFQPRRLAVMPARKLLAMTDVCSNQYSRHIFTCDFSGQSGQKVFRIERAKKLNGIHANGNRIYVCDMEDCSVFIVDYSDSQGRHKRVACDESLPHSVSTWGTEPWMLVMCGFSVTLYSLDSLLPVSGIQAKRSQPGPRESTFYVKSSSVDAPVQQYRDIVHLSNGSFVVNTATSVTIHNADMIQLRSFGVGGPAVPGVLFEDLMGMCATEQDGKVRIFLCDRGQKQISVIDFDA